MSGHVITLDGGEKASNAGEFNGLKVVTEEEWDMMAAMIKSINKKGS